MRLFLPLLLLACPVVRAAEVVVFEPLLKGGEYTLTVHMTNPGEGTYNSAELFVLQGLYQADLSPTLNVRGPPSGDSFSSWSAVFDAEGVVQISHGRFSFNIWDTETMNLGSVVSATVLEENGQSGHQPFTLADVQDPSWNPSAYDAIIVRSDDPLLAQPNYKQPKPNETMEVAFVGVEDGFNSYPASGHYYLLLTPGDFAGWTEYAGEHPALDPDGDANGNGRSNFLDYASGQDPEDVALPPVELAGSKLTLRQRINGLDAVPEPQFSDNLADWFPLEDGVHYAVAGETVSGEMRTWVLDLLPAAPPARFFRQHFGP